MFSKKQLIIISLILAILFHFAFYFDLYGPSNKFVASYPKFFFAFGSVLIMIFLYFGTYWRRDLRGNSITLLFDLLVFWVFICFFRSLLEIRNPKELIPFLFYNYSGLSLFPILFFIVGINLNYFNSVNKILLIYLFLAALISFFFINYFEFQIFLLMPLFYVIVTIPLRSTWTRILIIIISLSVVIVSLTNRAGIIRITASYCIVIAYYIMMNVKISKKFINVIVLSLLMIPMISLYMGLQGKSVFQITLGDKESSSQLNPYADTRTFLYYEVFQDIKNSDAIIFGKGMNAGYYSESFNMFSRTIVEVCFLQILLKTGIVGFILYISIIISGIFKALSKSKNLFLKSLGLLLAIYTVMIFIENQIAYNLINVVIWIVVGMCHSPALRELSNEEIKDLLINPKFNSKLKAIN